MILLYIIALHPVTFISFNKKDTMKIQQDTSENSSCFYIEEDNKAKAQLDYEIRDKNTLLIMHTEVDGNLNGKGIGKQLVAAAVEYARNNSLKVNAACTFAKKVLDRTKEFADVYKDEKNKS